jgi:methenyltetrahydrofolate cyclohydrolase
MVVATPVRYLRMEELSKQTLEAFLDSVAASTPAPGGGSSAAVAAALAAALVEMAARIGSAGGGPRSGAAEQAGALRARALRLAQEELTSYAPVLEARDEHERELALAAACEPPAQIAETAADVAELGVEVAESSSSAVRGDALTGVVLAEAAASAAFRLVEINVGRGPVLERARRAALRAVDVRASATGRPPPPPHVPIPR